MKQIARSQFLGLTGATALGLIAAPRLALAETPALIQGVLDGYLRAHPEQPNLALAVGVVAPGLGSPRLFFAGSPVAAQDHGRSLTLNATTPFLIGSITKVFTSRVYAMRQGDYGKLLGDCLALALPERLKAVPIRALANYSSGFPTDNHTPIWWRGVVNAESLSALVDSLRAHPDLPPCTPGSAYSYSNFAFGLLGLAAIGAGSLDRPLAQEYAAAFHALGARIGLSSTTAPWNASTARSLPAGYNPRGLVPASADYGRPNWLVLGGGGNLVSTPSDMLRWLEYNMGRTGIDGALLGQQQRASYTFRERVPPSHGIPGCAPQPMRQPVTTALGWFHAQPSRFAVPTLSKNGGVVGFSSWMAFEGWVDSGAPSPIGVVALANAPAAADRVGVRVYRALTGRR